MNKIAIVYHRVDFDGICSYAVIRHHLTLSGGITGVPVEITPFPWNRGDRVPDLKGFDRVFVVDVCLPAEVMDRLSRQTRLVWIDHHSTSIAEMAAVEGFEGRCDGIRRLGKGACELSWEYMCRWDTCPYSVQLLSAYDVWDKDRFDWEKDTLAFQYGLRNRYGLDAEAFCLHFPMERKMNGRIRKICDEGEAIVSYIRRNGLNAARNYGFDVTVAGTLKGLALLTDAGGSTPFEEAAAERGAELVVTLNRVDDNHYKMSCYSPGGKPGVHLGDYMKRTYGGGGHEGAAGAILTEEQFIKFLRNKTL